MGCVLQQMYPQDIQTYMQLCGDSLHGIRQHYEGLCDSRLHLRADVREMMEEKKRREEEAESKARRGGET